MIKREWVEPSSTAMVTSDDDSGDEGGVSDDAEKSASEQMTTCMQGYEGGQFRRALCTHHASAARA